MTDYKFLYVQNLCNILQNKTFLIEQHKHGRDLNILGNPGLQRGGGQEGKWEREKRVKGRGRGRERKRGREALGIFPTQL